MKHLPPRILYNFVETIDFHHYRFPILKFDDDYQIIIVVSMICSFSSCLYVKALFFLEAIKEAELIDLFGEFFKTLFRLIDEEFLLLLILVRTAVFNLEPDNSNDI